MRREQKILVTILWGLAVLMMLSVVGGGLWARRQTPLDILFDGPKFSLTDQNGKTVSDQTLKGNVWVAMAFFTQCPGVCPMMSGRMEQLQKAMPQQDVKIVSFSLDPEHDTPDTMKAYAERFKADGARWHMLTGQQETMYSIVNGLGLPAMPAKDGNPIVHSARAVLIDRQNRVRATYDTNDDDAMKRLADDAQALAAERGSTS